VWVVLGAFSVVNKRRKDDNTEDEEEYKQTELVGAGFERLNENLEAGRMTSQLEQPHYANYTEHTKHIG